MGCFDDEESKARKASREIERRLALEQSAEKKKMKLLLLGAGESGKSTIFKQMRVLYGAPLTEQEKNEVTPIVYVNTLSSMKLLVKQTSIWGYQEQVDPSNSEHFKLITDVNENVPIDINIGTAIKALWKDAGILQTWKRRAEFQIVESVKYYFNEIDRIMQPGFVATQQDMLLARVRTSGIVTEKYIIDGVPFEMYDVGGQRNERKKWIHCFDDVTAVIFVAALSEYDQVLFEDATTNRMTEAVQLFADICNNKYFKKSSLILFMNKRDLFEEKIKNIDIKLQPDFNDFPCAMGATDYYEQGLKYFIKHFTDVNENPEERMIYTHAVCATDTSNVQIVMNSCKDIILRGNLTDSGFV